MLYVSIRKIMRPKSQETRDRSFDKRGWARVSTRGCCMKTSYHRPEGTISY